MAQQIKRYYNGRVAAFNIGSIKEIVSDGYNGVLSQYRI
jgi:hypothetical protein